MALLDLSGGQLSLLTAMVVEENPELKGKDLNALFHPAWTPKLQEDGSVSLRLTGKSGVGPEGGFGYFDFKYRRIDLDKYFLNVTPVVTVHQPTSIADVLRALADQYGIVLTEEVVEPVEVPAQEGPITLRFKTNYVIANTSLTIEYREPEVADISKIFTVSKLPGFTSPWPYPVALSGVFTVSRLPGFDKPDLIWHLDEISKYWMVDEEHATFLAALEVGGAWDANALVAAVNAASDKRQGVWTCVSTEAPLNLWNAYIEYNGVPERQDLFAESFSRVIKIRPSQAYLPQGRGTISIYYDI